MSPLHEKIREGRETNPKLDREPSAEAQQKLDERRRLAAQAGPLLSDEEELARASAGPEFTGPASAPTAVGVEVAAIAAPADPVPADAEAAQVDALKVRAFVREVTVREAAAGKLGVLRPSRIEGLDHAGAIFLDELEPGQRDTLLNVSREDGLPVWALMCAAIARSADLHELNAGYMNPDWLNRDGGRRSVAGSSSVAVSTEAVCGRCGHVIPNAIRGQRACCNAHGSGHDAHTPGCAFAGVPAVHGFVPVIHAAVPIAFSPVDANEAIRELERQIVLIKSSLKTALPPDKGPGA